ncbi:hypothetical protein [Aeromonas caviae]|uniref:hypothetical protein n=1 Tax=Aeromonas caviae TaxID=648 RepID=UPI00069CD985|nr:hypothetical protein [Aeromonas caviae]
MDKVNEAIEVSEQETPFHLLPQEEQQHIIDANRKRVREAPTLHEWNIRVRNSHAWLIISIPIGILILIGAWLALGDNMASIGWGFIIMGGASPLFSLFGNG